ncbi:MAG: hypothetical protein MZV63_30500 [Marinilabiliales bacterium]|nr:hypothetical protein [Marinilabiliales bacterium]
MGDLERLLSKAAVGTGDPARGGTAEQGADSHRRTEKTVCRHRVSASCVTSHQDLIPALNWQRR